MNNKSYSIMLKALEEIADYSKDHEIEAVFNTTGWVMMEIAKKALEEAK